MGVLTEREEEHAREFDREGVTVVQTSQPINPFIWVYAPIALLSVAAIWLGFVFGEIKGERKCERAHTCDHEGGHIDYSGTGKCMHEVPIDPQP